jgi:isochorismate pyruvate lyase
MKAIKKATDCENMSDVREAIDQIDHQIVELIAQRAEYVYKAAAFKNSKTEVKDADRVRKVIESKKNLAREYGISPDLIGNIYSTMINFFINEELERWKNK